MVTLVEEYDFIPCAQLSHKYADDRRHAAGEQHRFFPAVERLAGREELLARMAEPATFAAGQTGTGRVGLLTASVAAVLSVKRTATDPLLEPGLSGSSRGLDVNALAVTIDKAYGDDATSMAADGRLWYVKHAAVATQQGVDEEASAAFNGRHLFSQKNKFEEKIKKVSK